MTEKQQEQTFQICSERIGFDVDTLDSRKLIVETSKPALLIHGRYDDYVPVNHALETYQARPEGTKLVIYKDSKHGDYFINHFEDFRTLCLDWFGVHLLGDSDKHLSYGIESR